MNENLERFLRYVKIDTQSNSESDTVPSASKELNLTRLLQKELSEMGIDSEIDEYGILYGHLDGEDDLEPIPFGAAELIPSPPDISYWRHRSED